MLPPNIDTTLAVDLGLGAFGLVLGVVLTSFFEYCLHRYQHWSTWKYCPLGVGHRHHHATEHMPFLPEFLHYFVGYAIGAKIVYAVFPKDYVSSVCVPTLISGAAYTVFAAYAHTLQHENPTLCTWMKMPVHFAHHHGHMWHHNFGIGVDWWDRVFGTYKEIEWCTPEMVKSARPNRLDISWVFMKRTAVKTL